VIYLLDRVIVIFDEFPVKSNFVGRIG